MHARLARHALILLIAAIAPAAASAAGGDLALGESFSCAGRTECWAGDTLTKAWKPARGRIGGRVVSGKSLPAQSSTWAKGQPSFCGSAPTGRCRSSGTTACSRSVADHRADAPLGAAASSPSPLPKGQGQRVVVAPKDRREAQRCRSISPRSCDPARGAATAIAISAGARTMLDAEVCVPPAEAEMAIDSAALSGVRITALASEAGAGRVRLRAGRADEKGPLQDLGTVEPGEPDQWRDQVFNFPDDTGGPFSRLQIAVEPGEKPGSARVVGAAAAPGDGGTSRVSSSTWSTPCAPTPSASTAAARGRRGSTQWRAAAWSSTAFSRRLPGPCRRSRPSSLGAP